MKTKLKTAILVFVALVKCNAYLLYCMLWKLQPICQFQCWDHEGKTSLVAAVTGSLSKDNIVCKKIFFNATGFDIPLDVVIPFRNQANHGFTYHRE